MKAKYVPFIVTVIALGSTTLSLPADGQLPPTNMGKYVHQPGDNQYSDTTQRQRHPVAPPPQMRVMSRPGVTGITPASPKPDVTLEPIAADEPIPPPTFPPLPDRLDLPVGNQGSWTRAGGAGSYDGGGGAAAGVAGGAAAISPTYHQHYGHVAPGAFLQKPSGTGYYKAVDPGVPAKGGSGYYKARTPGSEYYSTNTGNSPGAQPPQYTGASGKDLKALGREPRLNERTEEPQAPDAPQPVVVSQSTTQDLSLPEDEFSYRYSNKKKGFRAPPMVRGPLNAVGGMTGVRF